MPSPDKTRTTPAADAQKGQDPPQRLAPDPSSPPTLWSRPPPHNARVYDWVMQNPPTDLSPSLSQANNKQMGSVATSASHEVGARSTQRETAPATATATATVRQRFQHLKKVDKKTDSLNKEQASSNDNNAATAAAAAENDKDNDKAKDIDILAFADCWNHLKTEQATDILPESKTSSSRSALGDIVILIVCAVHWLTIMAIVCVLSGLVIVARTGYRLGLRKRG